MSKSKNYPKATLKYKVTVSFYEYDDDGRTMHRVEILGANGKQIFDPLQELKVFELVQKVVDTGRFFALFRQRMFETYGNEILTEDPFEQPRRKKNKALQKAKIAVSDLVNTLQEGRNGD